MNSLLRKIKIIQTDKTSTHMVLISTTTFPKNCAALDARILAVIHRSTRMSSDGQQH